MSGIGSEFMAPVLQDQAYRHAEQNQPAQLAHTLASTRYTSAMADQLETRNIAEKRLAAMMAQGAGTPAQVGGNGSISENLSGLASMYALAGMPDKAAEYMAKASQAQAHEATARAALAREAASKVKLAGDQFKMASNLLSGVKDQESWNEANRLFEQQTGQESPFKNIPYDPKVVETLNNAALSAYQKQQLEFKGKELSLKVADVKSAIESRATRDTVAVERLRVSQQREKRIEKAGGKDLGAPSKVETQQAARLLGDTGLEGDELDNAAFSIASEAKAIRRKNPGVSADEALRQATLKAKENGSIIPGEKHLLSRNTPAKFSPPTGGVKSLPATADKLVKGHVYADGKGNIAEWDGKGWTNKRKASAAPAAPAGGGSDGEDPSGDDDE